MPKTHRYYYFDETRDDFACDGIDGKPTPSDYRYLPKTVFGRIAKSAVYYFYFILVSPVFLWIRLRVRNAGVLKHRKDRKKGYFVYGNHTCFLTDAVSLPVAAFPREAYVICNPDAISVKGIGRLVRMLGALPTPSTLRSFRSFREAIRTLYDKGSPITVYPEAHIWPKYHGIRNFPDDSFAYPVELDAPCFVKTTVYRKKRNGTTRPTVYLDGPFYPDPTLAPKEARRELRDRVYAEMCRRAAEEHSAPDPDFLYTRVDSPDKVRAEISRK